MTNKAPPGMRKACTVIPREPYRHARSATLTDMQTQLKALEVQRPWDAEGNEEVGTGQVVIHRPYGAWTKKVHGELSPLCCLLMSFGPAKAIVAPPTYRNPPLGTVIEAHVC